MKRNAWCAHAHSGNNEIDSPQGTADARKMECKDGDINGGATVRLKPRQRGV